ncbi:unnamed protein product [Musa acuminata subsp. burmannicoides]
MCFSPYSAEDARGLLKPDPVVFLENELLYGESFPISAEVLDSSFCLPIGKAKVYRTRRKICNKFSKMVGHALQVAEILSKEGISAEVDDIVRAVKRACYRSILMAATTYRLCRVGNMGLLDVIISFIKVFSMHLCVKRIIQSNARGQKRHFQADGVLTPEVPALGASCAAVAVASRTTASYVPPVPTRVTIARRGTVLYGCEQAVT